MNHCVPEFEMDDDYSIPSSSVQNRPRKSSVGPEDDIVELLWQDGQVVMQSQNQRSGKKQPRYDAVAPPDQSAPRQNPNQHLFMEEDEMASWLHYPLNDAAFDQDFCADLLYPNTTSSAMDPQARPPDTASFVAAAAGSSKPPIPAPRRAEAVQNFAYFSRHKAAAGPSSSKAATMVESCDTPAGNVEKEATTYDLTSSPGCSSASAEPSQNPSAEDRKRKGRERSDDSEDVEFESADAKKQARGSTSTKRARAAEVHNLSERRRRDRINEKMKALQELIPRCNKSDKASMLDEVIEYLKSLQLQVQMMSMGCSMVPMMYPGMQQYMPPMGLGMGMGMGIGMEMGMNRPMMHFPNVLPGSAMPPATAAPGHFGPRFPMPHPFPMPPVSAPPDQSRIQGNNQSDTVHNNPLSMQNPNQPRIPHFADPYQQYFGFQQMQLPPPPQNQGMAQASTSRGAENPENDQPG